MLPTPRPIEPDGLFDGLRWSAILRGAVLDNVLSFVALGALLVYLTPEALSEDEEAASRAMDQALVSPEFMFLSVIVGFPITVYAAFWAARRAGTLHLRHGGWTAVVSVALPSLFLLLPGANRGPHAPLWYDALSLALMLVAGLLGGWLAGRRAGPT